MIPAAAWSLVAEPGPVPDWVHHVARQARFEQPQYAAYLTAMRLLESLSWQDLSQAITNFIAGLRDSRLEKATPNIDDVSAGFIRYGLEPAYPQSMLRARQMSHSDDVVQSDNERWTFGVVIGISFPGLGLVGTPSSDELGDWPLPLHVVLGHYPVLVELRELRFGAPPTPSGVSSSCYVKPRSSKRFYGPTYQAGILTARHVLSSLGYAYGTSVPMNTGSPLSLVDVDPAATTIDAAILDCGTLPSSANVLPLASAVAPGTKVEIRTPSSLIAADVLRVHDHPKYFGNMVAHRLFTDNFGASGDSGSLVRTVASPNEAAGVYMGTTPPGPSCEGLAQSMRQIAAYFDVDLYD